MLTALVISAFVFLGCTIEGLGDIGITPTPTENCGNGSIEGTEVCDDGNAITETKCDYGTETCTACDASCKNVLNLTGLYCGDGVCSANFENDTACPADCFAANPVCGDGIAEGAEVCDDGNTITETACAYGTETCTFCNNLCDTELFFTGEFCGDGTCNGPEDTASCLTDCPTTCGDGIVEGAEVCDDANTITETACAYGTETCIFCNDMCNTELFLSGDFCGDGACNGPEDTNSCLTDCPTTCGDGVCNGTETYGTCSTDCPDGDNTYESATSIAVGSSAVGFIDTFGDHDYFSVTMAADQTIVITTDDGNGCNQFDTELYLFDSDGITQLSMNDDYTGLCSQITYTNTSGAVKTVYFYIAHYADNNTGAYTVAVIMPVVCGDGIVEGAEVCDDGNTITETACAYGTASCTACNAACSSVLTLAGMYCGDGTCNAGYEDTASCAVDCPAADTSPPVFSNIYYTGAGSGAGGAFTVGDTITLFADVTDASGVSFAELYVFQADLMNYAGYCNASLIGGNTYSCAITVPAGYIPNGTEHILPYAMDVLGYADYYYFDTYVSSTYYTRYWDGTMTTIPIVLVPMTEPAVCGNGVIEGAEACDDGNTISNDGCSSVCQFDTDTTPAAYSNIYYTGTGSGTGGAFIEGDTITLYADVTDFSGISSVTLYVYQADIFDYPGYCTAALIGGDTYSCSFTISAGYVPNGTEHIIVAATDSAGNYEFYYYDTAVSSIYYTMYFAGMVTTTPIVFVPITEAVTYVKTGDYVEYANTSGFSANYLLGQKVTVSSNMTLTHMGLITKAASAAGQWALYTNNTDLPGTLIANTAQHSVLMGDQMYAIVQGSVSLSAGTYWIMGVYNPSASMAVDTTVTTNKIAYISFGFGGALPATFPNPSVYNGTRFNYYLYGTSP